MKITVAICTWNRAGLLHETLKSLAEVRVPAGVHWQVLVADNNSTDHTRRVLRTHRNNLPLDSLVVAEQGKSHALNAVIERLDGDLVLFTDDDVLFDRGWMEAYVDAANRWPEAGFFGGHVVPMFLAPEPHWLRPAWKRLGGVYAARELGDQPFSFTQKCLPFGANVAMRVALQKQYRYNTALGRQGTLLLAGEETEQMARMVRDGHSGMWVPGSRVRHVITPDRMEVAHINRFYFGLGTTIKRKDEQRSRGGRLVNGLWYMLHASMQCASARLSSERWTPSRWIKSRARASYLWGRASVQWRELPAWIKPSAMKGTLAKSSQPRFKPTEAFPLQGNVQGKAADAMCRAA